jgi:hypothetical protein
VASVLTVHSVGTTVGTTDGSNFMQGSWGGLGSNGSVNLRGGPGGSGAFISVNLGPRMGGQGGSSFLGGGAPSLGTPFTPSAWDGNNGNNADANTGAGGSGACGLGTSTKSGGEGASGIVVVEEYA